MSDTVPIEPPRIFATFRYRDPKAMIDFLTRAFGFEVRASYGEGDEIAHAELTLGSSMIMLGQTRDDAYGRQVGEPGTDGGKALYIAVDDADAVFARARDAGATIVEEPVDRDYGSRDFSCRDPEGNLWNFGTYWPKAHEKEG